ncbi:MAG TPA: SRPBCC domain-containing protein [Candidatus Dormibacteraeota bacterium]
MEPEEEALPAQPEVVKELDVRAPIEKVWEALTDAESIQAWMRSGDVEVDLRPGGSYRFFGGETTGVFTRVMRPHALEYSWRQAGWDPEWSDSVVAWDLRPDGEDATHIHLRHTAFPNEEELQAHDARWDEYFLGPLRDWLEG